MISDDTITLLPDNHDHDYDALLRQVAKSFSEAAAGQTVLFRTDANDLFDLYLNSFPSEHRQLHNCRSCKRFIETFGGLVTISPKGHLRSVMWQWALDLPDFYRPTFAVLQAAVEDSKVIGAFKSAERVWGSLGDAEWTHIVVTPPAALVHKDRLHTPGASMAHVTEDFKTILNALSSFKPATIDEAIRILKADALAGAAQYVAPMEWLRKLHDRPKGKYGSNVLWREIALAPKGYLHPRAGMTGYLLDDLASGMSFDMVKRRFDDKMQPLKKSRPQAAPTAGNIKAAEAIISKLGLEPSLHRRFLRFDEIPEFVWTPPMLKPAEREGVFGHLLPKGGRDEAPVAALPRQTMTWVKFVTKVLPTASAIDLLTPYSSGAFHAMLTAADMDAPPIIKWDREDARNPVSWYLYPRRSSAGSWGLRANAWAKVNGITPFPTQWSGTDMPFLAEGALLILDGAKDSHDSSGNALFPNFLKDDLHEIRATIEAYSKTAKIGGREDASANGYGFRSTGTFPSVVLRVAAGKAVSEYAIDRWD